MLKFDPIILLKVCEEDQIGLCENEYFGKLRPLSIDYQAKTWKDHIYKINVFYTIYRNKPHFPDIENINDSHFVIYLK